MSKEPLQSATVGAAFHTGRAGLSLQPAFDVAVVIPTILRPELGRAVRSVFAQEGVARVHLLIGIDKAHGNRDILDALRLEVPDGVLLTVLDLGYSTSQRHGGMHAAGDGGALRTVMSYLANARYIAYLDDDNWWAPDHLVSLLQAIHGKDWAYSYRWYVDPETSEPLIIDALESVGPGRGGYAASMGGWVDPNCLMVDAKACEPVFRLWCHPLFDNPSQMSADRQVFEALRKNPRVGETNRATCFYTINPYDEVHQKRMEWIARQERN